MKLFEPGKIGKLAIKNRIVMAPMGLGGLEESCGELSQRGIDYYAATRGVLPFKVEYR